MNLGRWTLPLFLVSALTGIAIFAGCDGDSAEEILRNLGIDVTGFYAHPDDGNLVANNTGNPVVNMNIVQAGDQLEGVDNNGIVFKGTIGSANDGVASFNMDGATTTGAEATMSGTFNVEGNLGTMQGTWIEPTLVSTIFGEATVPNQPPPDGGTNNVGNGDGDGNGGAAELSVMPSGSLTVQGDDIIDFQASGGTGNYTWSVSVNSLGSVNPTTGANTTYEADGTGLQALTLSDGTSEILVVIDQL